ncbi:MAG: phage tail tape measure protein, partial [Oscillospiraceae bacterium]
MARDIATKITVEGDGEYKNAIKGIEGELKTLKSEMALASSAFKNQQDSMEALTAKGELLARQYEQQAQKVQVMRSAQENAANVSETLAQKAEAYRRKMEETEGALKKLESTTENTTQEQADLLKELEKSAKELEKIERAQQNAAKSADTWTQSANYAEAALNRLSGEIEENNQAIQKLDGTADKAEESLHEIGESAEKSGESIDQMGTQTSGALEAMAGALVAAGVQKTFEEIMAVIEECLAASKEFNKGMAETFTLLPGLSSEMKDQMSGDLLELKTEMAIVGKDGTDALYQAVSAGVSAGKSMEFMETAQKAAVGGVTTLTTAVDGLTSVTNAYGEENVNAQQAADLMFTAVRLGKTNFEQLSGSLYN